MRRWTTLFVTVWLTPFVPSFIGWGLVVRWSDAGIGRFQAVWSWFADRLAYPLVLSPIVDPSWRLLRDGAPLTVTFAFVVLVAAWAAIFALPVAFLSAWANALLNRSGPNAGRATAADIGATTYSSSGSRALTAIRKCSGAALDATPSSSDRRACYPSSRSGNGRPTPSSMAVPSSLFPRGTHHSSDP